MLGKLVICDALREFVPFVQIKKREKHPWRSVTFKKIPPWVFFTFFKLYKWYQITQIISNIKKKGERTIPDMLDIINNLKMDWFSMIFDI